VIESARRRCAFGLGAVAASLLLATSTRHLTAQGTLPPATGTPGVAGELRTVDGRLLRGGSGAPQPVGGEYVVLHRISADAAGPIDSVRTSAAGAYRFRYRLESTNAMYIVSARHDGVAYFSVPLREAAVSGAEADLVVYDTTSRRFPLAIRSRHFVVSPADESGLRRVVDVFEVANDSTRTLVVGGGGGGTWEVRLPPAAQSPETSGGDVPAEALRFSDGVARLEAPFPPGARQLVLSYGIPADGSVEVPLDAGTARIEVLVEGGGVTLGGATMAAEPPVTMEGRTFQRFVGGPIGADASFTLRWGGGLSGSSGRLALLAIAAVAVTLGVLFGRRMPGRVAPAGPSDTGAEALARAIASLDRVYASPERQDAGSRAAWEARRAELKSQLVSALAVEDRDPPR
jgi:hypothetical protein